MLITPLEKAIKKAGGQTALAANVTALGKVVLSQSTISAWLNRFQHVVGHEFVLAICEASDWEVTPHELRPDIYPHPDDGLPPELRCDCKKAAA